MYGEFGKYVKESDIENSLVQEKLKALGYTYRPDIKDRQSLEANFRQKFEELNRVKLSDSEFSRLLEQIVTPDIFKSSKILRSKNTFERDDGTPLDYTLVNTKNWCKNSFEVINQLRINTKNSFQRYDVILLINGLPLVQIELKTLQTSPRKAIAQIIDYKSDPGNGYTNTLLAFMQIFIVSNGTTTWYFANNRNEHFKFNADEQFLPIYTYADRKNRKITELSHFCETFLRKCTLAETISRYMVLVESEQKILMMRPYQIYAVESIIQSIEENRGNGYIWHTTGSGKTLTSFKASTLLKENPNIHKCLFVVDRKDLDRQTREEFNRFQEGCVEENTNTHTLVERLLSDDKSDKVIVTTIQKLGLALDEKNPKGYKEKLKPLQNKRMVFIFDECHRSQFGQNHKAIKDFFPKAQLFGFTGTPIFPKNATVRRIDGQEATLMTTEDIFQNRLHTYTIGDAINDKNVLKFHIDYYQPEGGAAAKAGDFISKKAVVETILNKHGNATAQRRFNAILATASIDDAIEYFKLFKTVQEQRAENEEFVPLNIACVFSPPAEGNRDIAQLQEDLPQEQYDNQKEPNRKKEALAEIIDDYNRRYNTNFSIAQFDAYYQDVQKRIKDHKYPDTDLPYSKKIDITIVVDMLLTGFDSKYLNTLYVDKNLKYHGLIQAFSRTNRVLNDTKPYGNILDFRSQHDAVDEAITLFSDKDKKESKKIWLAESADETIEKLEAAKERLETVMESYGVECEPEEVANLKGDEAKAAFIKAFKEIQRLHTRLEQYTDLSQEQKDKIEEIIPINELRAFRASYLETARELKQKQQSGEDISPVVEALDFEFVLFASAMIDYDYIMRLLAKYSSQEPKKQKMTKKQLVALLKSYALEEDQEDIIAYIDTLEAGKGLSEEEIKKGYEKFKKRQNQKRLEAVAKSHNIDIKILEDFINRIVKRRIFDAQELTDLLAPLGFGWKERKNKEQELMKDLIPLLKKMVKGREISGLEVYL